MRNLKLIIAILIISTQAYSQIKVHPDSTWVIETTDGNTYTGSLEVIEEGKIYELTTRIGVLKIKKTDIKNMKKVESSRIRNGDYWPDNPHSSRYFFAPSGYGLRKGEGYYSNAWIFFNQLSYGFTNYFTVGVGIVPTFLFGVREVMPYWITPKFNFDLKNHNGAIGFGTIYFNALGSESSNNGFGLLYGSGTIGTREKQLTLGVGLGYANGEFSTIPAFTASGLVRTGKKWALITENYFIFSEGEGFVLGSFGARYMAKRLAIDFGGFLPLSAEVGTTIVLPWLGINVPFGKRY